jgi:hypothetical protein
LAWQYTQDCNNVDCNQANPRFQEQLLSQLITVPEPAIAAVELLLTGAQIPVAGLDQVSKVFEATISQLLSAKGQELTQGKPYLFPNGVHRIELTVGSLKLIISDE